jgi:5-formyltetrahydrofolate cyclo-ligase
MSAEVQQAKAALREEMRARLRALSPAVRVAASEQIRSRLSELPEWTAARCVLLFTSLPQEPDLTRVIIESLASGKIVALPRFSTATQTYGAARVRTLGTDLTSGKFNVLEPVATCEEIPSSELDLILVPGLAFDLRGGRLGRGRGFYDRLLAHVRAKKCGVAFDEQIADAVPTETNDVRMDCLVTPTRWIIVEK